jgi:ribosome-associated translation inhibitor RaiA
MQVQFNTDHNIIGNQESTDPLVTLVSEGLGRFSKEITRIEVHLSDENSSEKDGLNDKRCMLEARLEGREPVAVTNNADTSEQAVTGAIDKLNNMLDTILGRSGEHR